MTFKVTEAKKVSTPKYKQNCLKESLVLIGFLYHQCCVLLDGQDLSINQRIFSLNAATNIRQLREDMGIFLVPKSVEAG